MIRLEPPLTLNGRFSAQDLPDELQLPLLHSMVVPRIVSSSMTPTIQEGDKLELSSSISLTRGAIVVFRNDNALVCHRIIAIDPHGMLSTKGDATQDTFEVVQPGSVIGVVTGVMRNGTHISLGNNPYPSSTTQPTSRTDRVQPIVFRSVITSIRILAKLPLFQPLLVLLLQYTATVDVLAPIPLQSLLSYSKITSFTLRVFPRMTKPFAVSIEQKSTRYMIRLGSWRLAQYDPTTKTLLLRQSLQDAGLEPFFRSMLRRTANNRIECRPSFQAQHTPTGCSKRPSSKAAADERTGGVPSGVR